MNRASKRVVRDEIAKEYDFSNGVRGKYADRFRTSSNVVVLEPDVAEYFKDSTSVNDALRVLIRIAKQKKKAAR